MTEKEDASRLHTIAHFDSGVSSSQFAYHIEKFLPFVSACLPVDKSLLIGYLSQHEEVVDVSCAEQQDFRGDSMSRELITMKLSSFMEGFKALSLGDTSHSILMTRLNLFLCQGCIFSTSEDFVPIFQGLDELYTVPECLSSSKYNLLSVHLWLNYFRAVTNLHYDAYNNLLCVLNGKKKVILISPEHTALVSPHSAASLVRPNHSSRLIDFEGQQLFHGIPHIVVEVVEGNALFIPEGWWHFVESDQCTIAINFWFESPLIQILQNASHMTTYMLRSSYHELMKQDIKSYDTSLREYVAVRLASHDRCITTNDCRRCQYRQFAQLINDLNGWQVDNQTAQDEVCDLEISLVNSAVHKSVMWLWPNYAEKNPTMWTNVLLGLSPKVAYYLTLYWETMPSENLNPTEAEQPLKRSKITSSCDCPDDLCLLDPCTSLDDFFGKIFHPCGDKAAEVRRHLLKSIDVFAKNCSKHVTSDYLSIS